ncbi:hypothetical protein KQM30_002177 [Escherichia coli]|nr:hypothetical protein [Escherichia coli]
MKIYRLNASDLARAVMTQTGARRDEIIKVMQTDGVNKHDAETAFNRAMHGLDNVTIKDFRMVMRAADIQSWGIGRDGQFFAEIPARIPGGRKKGWK